MGFEGATQGNLSVGRDVRRDKRASSDNRFCGAHCHRMWQRPLAYLNIKMMAIQWDRLIHLQQVASHDGLAVR